MAAIRWNKGGEAEVIEARDDRIALRSTNAGVPGSRLEGTLEDGTSIMVKVARCKKNEGAFDIEGRLLDATREVRDRIARLAHG